MLSEETSVHLEWIFKIEVIIWLLIDFEYLHFDLTTTTLYNDFKVNRDGETKKYPNK